MTILLSSCSWGSGVWATKNDKSYGLIHGGACQYLREMGQDVVNLSGPGHDPWGLFYALKAFITCNNHLDFSIYYLQTDITRSWNYIKPEITNDPQMDLDTAYHRHYQQMDDMARQTNQKIKVIGGLTDVVIDLSPYSNLHLIEPSICRLIDPNVELTGMVDWYKIEKFLFDNYSANESLLKLIEKALARLHFYESRPDYFWPDGRHLNQQGHKILLGIISMCENLKEY